MNRYNTATLKGGLRVIHLPSAGNVVYCGYQIAAGTRHELPGEEGLAHFCEHMTFKGTSKYSALQIVNRLEQVGGDINAFTTKESTVYHCAILNRHIRRAVDLLTDMVFASIYPPEAIETEREVVCDEIESYNDSPAELIFDEFENLLFVGHPLGHSILGTAQRVRHFAQEDLLRFTRELYHPANSIFFCYGNVPFNTLVRTLENSLAQIPQRPFIPRKSAEATLRNQEATTITQALNTHQAHVMIGCRAYPIDDERRMPLYLLNNMLGGPAMSSRLNQAIRERNGLVYTVESTWVSYGDTGFWGIYFGCDPADVDRCLRLIRRELDRFMQKPLSESRLRTAKQQLKGQIGIACDSREQFALDFGKSFLHHGWERDIDQLYRDIDAITAEQIQKVALELFPKDHLTALIFK